MHTFNPIAVMHRLEAAGLSRDQSATLADELRSATMDHVTDEQLHRALEAQANKLTLRLGALMAATLTLGAALLRAFH